MFFIIIFTRPVFNINKTLTISLDRGVEMDVEIDYSIYSIFWCQS